MKLMMFMEYYIGALKNIYIFIYVCVCVVCYNTNYCHCHGKVLWGVACLSTPYRTQRGILRSVFQNTCLSPFLSPADRAHSPPLLCQFVDPSFRAFSPPLPLPPSSAVKFKCHRTEQNGEIKVKVNTNQPFVPTPI